MPELSLLTAFMLFATGIIAGIVNAIAGGGTFFTLPAFLAAGIPPVAASASNAVSVWPGHALAVFEYRRELSKYSRSLGGSIVVAVLGGAAGAAMLAFAGDKTFSKLIPFLVLFATLLFAFGQSAGKWLAARTTVADMMNPRLATRCAEFVIALYGGFFGAGLGVMLMAGLLMLGVRDVQANNALKNLLASVVTTVSVLVFALSGLVSWPHTAIAFAGAVAGGLLGARIARRLSPRWLRGVVIVVGLALSAYYFIEYHGPGR